MNHQITACIYLLPKKCRFGGFYMIEDLLTSNEETDGRRVEVHPKPLLRLCGCNLSLHGDVECHECTLGCITEYFDIETAGGSFTDWSRIAGISLFQKEAQVRNLLRRGKTELDGPSIALKVTSSETAVINATRQSKQSADSLAFNRQICLPVGSAHGSTLHTSTGDRVNRQPSCLSITPHDLFRKEYGKHRSSDDT